MAIHHAQYIAIQRSIVRTVARHISLYEGLSLHPVRWAGRPELPCKTLKKFPNIGLNADNQP